MFVFVIIFTTTPVFAQIDPATIITDTVTRTARKQVEKVIEEQTQKSLNTINTTAQNADNKIANDAESGLKEKAPFIHNNLYLPLDGWRIKQSVVWERMITQQELDTTGQIPESIKKVTQALDTTSGIVHKTIGTSNQNTVNSESQESVFSSSDAIQEAISGTSISPEQTLGKTYTLFLKLLLIIFKSRVLFYGLMILITLSIISRVVNLRTTN